MSKKIEMPSIGLVTEFDPSDRQTVTLKRSTRIDLGAFQVFYEAATGHKLTETKAVEELLRHALRSDKNYGAWKTANPQAVARVTAEVDAPPAKGKDATPSHEA